MSKDNKQKLVNHALHLKEQHDELDKQIIEEEAHHSNCAMVAILKKKKLKLKDEIEKCFVRINNLPK